MIVMLAAKSVLIASVTLLVLWFMRGRSASDRSWIAHLGLVAIAALPLGSVLFPPLEVTTSYASLLAYAAPAGSGATWTALAADWLLMAYAVPALVLIALTLLALFRLVLLTARARAVTDDHWLEALTTTRQRSGITKSAILLVSHEIASPVSWGALRPKILLNTDVLGARGDADAILAHELAHVARADWLKLMLVRVSVAMFWFNPFVWQLARVAHQLREEAADDAVLGADIEDTTYASLLVSSARHQPSGLLLGAHDVAPARNSLAQRVRRVLDRGLNRSASGTRWTAVMGVGAAALTAPLMILQLTDAALASSAFAPFAPDADAEVIMFELRAPPGEPSPLPPLSKEASGPDAADGEGAAGIVPAERENAL